jgi:hypothetical protein
VVAAAEGDTSIEILSKAANQQVAASNHARLRRWRTNKLIDPWNQ